MRNTRCAFASMVGLAALILACSVRATAQEEEEPAAAPVDNRPYYLDYTLGDPVPPGYQVVRRYHRAELTVGSILFGTSYTAAAFVGRVYVEASATTESFSQVPYEPRWLYLPILGPWVALVTSFMSHSCHNSYFTSSYYYGQCEAAQGQDLNRWRAFLVADGLAQGIGVALAIYGLTRPWYQLVLHVNDGWVTLQPAPIGRDGKGLVLAGGFRGL